MSGEAVIRVTSKTVGIWFFPIDSTKDWLAHLEEIEAGFKLTYKFRYYHEDPRFDKLDEKSWVVATFSGTKEQAIQIIEEALLKIESENHKKISRVLMHDGNLERFFNALSRNKWAHLKVQDA